MAGNHSVIATENLEMSLTAIKWQWEIEFARFFNYPFSLSATSSSLRPLSKSKNSSGGTWISSSTIAHLRLIADISNPETILVVSFRGKIIEEHFTCNLHFSWPQVSCVPECPTRGSRVVFASYRDCACQIQKFALRFSTSSDAQTFINALKESFKDAIETGLPRSNFGSEMSSQSEFVSSNGLQFRAEECILVDPVATFTPHMAPVLNHNCEQNKCSQESLLGENFEGICGALPPSFTALLTNCSAGVGQEQPKVPAEEFDLKSQIMVSFQTQRYMSDSSFHDMLTKVEEVINEMGGDLALN